MGPLHPGRERPETASSTRNCPAFKQKPALEHERDAHREFAEERCRHFVGRQDVLERIKDYLADPKANRPLVIHGVSGCGKTALMAEAVSGGSRSRCLRPHPSHLSPSFAVSSAPRRGHPTSALCLATFAGNSALRRSHRT